MKTTFLIFLYFIIALSNVACSQSNYILYSHYINKAELCIADQKYREALIYYDSALMERKVLFAKDAYNAALSAAIVKNNNKCYLYTKTLIDKGYSIKHIQSVDVLGFFFKTKNGKQLIKYSKHNEVKYNKVLRKIIDSLETADQFFRNKEGKYLVYMDTIKKIDASNSFCFVKFVEKYGFPSEEMVGIVDDSLLNGLSPYYAIIFHQQNGSPTSVMNFADILTAALKNGDIEPRIALELIDRSNGSDEYGSEACGLTKYVLDSVSSEKIKHSNPNTNYDTIGK